MSLEIARGSKTCSTCQKSMEGGMTIVSTLTQSEDTWHRVDQCEECYSKPEEKELATWKVLIPKKEKKGLVLSESAIWQVIQKAKEDDEVRLKPFTYILCLLMVRKRKLRMTRTTRRGGNTFQTYTNKSRGVDLEVMMPKLSGKLFKKLQTELTEFLSEDPPD